MGKVKIENNYCQYCIKKEKKKYNILRCYTKPIVKIYEVWYFEDIKDRCCARLIKMQNTVRGY